MYQGKHVIQQVENIKEFFEPFLKEEKFDTIIEIGTSFGGLTYLIDDIVKENDLPHNIHTFDLDFKDYVSDSLIKRNCIYHILDERDEKFKETVISLLINSGKCLLLCDGGNKIEEFNLYSKFLKSKDIIMAHDFCENKKEFEEVFEGKIWNWFEIGLDDIEQSIIKNKLTKYSKINFSNAAWACYVK